MNVLLVEPYYNRKYPPLGLMKISTWHKKKGDNVLFHRGNHWLGLQYQPDMIYVTSLFTWDLPKVVYAVNSFKKQFKNSIINVGGVGATAMPDYVYKKTGIMPHKGILKEVDECAPDYDLFPTLDESLLFTTRGCIHNCKYCIVKDLEPERYIIKNWKNSIDENKKKIIIFDNNILMAGDAHFKNVLKVLKKYDKPIDINSGFDCLVFKKKHAELISDLKINPIRFAFDKMSQEKPLLKSLQYCKEAGINLNKIRVYVLFNFKDTMQEARYRADKIIELGCKPFVMNYKPLDWIHNYSYISEHWTKNDIINFSYYYNMPVIWNTLSYDEFIEEKSKKIFELLRHKKKKKNNMNNTLDSF